MRYMHRAKNIGDSTKAKPPMEDAIVVQYNPYLRKARGDTRSYMQHKSKDDKDNRRTMAQVVFSPSTTVRRLVAMLSDI